MHRNSISLVERGLMSMSIETLDLICEALGFRPWQMLLEAESLCNR
jgi:transcriptional regulator with XRE-family HTH domain